MRQARRQNGESVPAHATDGRLNYRSASLNCDASCWTGRRIAAAGCDRQITTHVATYERLITPARRRAVIDCNCVRRARPGKWPWAGGQAGCRSVVHWCRPFVDGCPAQPFVPRSRRCPVHRRVAPSRKWRTTGRTMQ